MKKIVFLLCIIIFCQKIIEAQQVSLKHPLSEADYISLDKVAKNCFTTIELNINLDIDIEGFRSNEYIKPDRPDSLKHIFELEKEIKGNYRDAQLYSRIGLIYKRLYMPEEAYKNFSKALNLAKEYVKNNPDSASAYSVLGASFFGLGNFTEAGLANQQSYDLKNDSIVLAAIPLCYAFSGNFSSALTVINSIIDKDPNNSVNYLYLASVLYMQILAELPRPGPEYEKLESSLKGKSPDEIMDLTKIKSAYERNKKDIQRELLYRYCRHLSLFLKSVFRTTAQLLKSENANNLKFLLDESDLIEFGELESFYKTCLNDSKIPNKVNINKALGNIYLLKSQTKSAIPYLEKTIELKPLTKSTFGYNAASDYDNLASAYLLLKDTVSFEKVSEKKYNVRPAINPLPEDCISMARISLRHNDYLNARKYSEEALKINPYQADAYICLAILDILTRDTKNAGEKLNASYKIDPNNYSLYVLQGTCLLYDNDISTAYASFQFAKKLTRNPAWIDEKIINKYFAVETK